MHVVALSVGTPALLQHEQRTYRTAINKCAVPGPLTLSLEGFPGDAVADTVHHGGPDKAACCYPHEHYPYWEYRLGSAFTPPVFGENLTTSGLLEKEVAIGDRLAIGGAVVQVSQPRQPCWKLANKHATPELIAWILEQGYTGFYVRALQPGPVAAGDAIRLLDRPHPELTVALVMRTMLDRRPARDVLLRLAELPALSAAWREQMARKLASLE